MEDHVVRKNDELYKVEKTIQTMWEKTHEHQTKTNLHNKKTYFATFPYPYMNGYLHIGHMFTMSKYDFICRFYRSIGYDVLQPFSFHLTGMPIVAASDKLKADIEYIKHNGSSELLETSQYNIMKKMGICDDDMPNFSDPKYWGVFFPEAAKKTLKNFGIAYDETRSFITTDNNPYYDKFVKWQFTKLFEKNALKFGTRYDLFSPKELQACLGHERSTGEDAKPTSSCLIMFKISMSQNFHNIHLNQLIATHKDIFVLVSTSRPETLQGVTNLWIRPDGTYSIYLINCIINKVDNKSMFWICQDRNIENLKFQTRFTDDFHITGTEKVCEITGSDLINVKIDQHMLKYVLQNDIYIKGLNFQKYNSLLQIDMNKGTGILMSVPTESPIDYIGYMYCKQSDNFDFFPLPPIKPIIMIQHPNYTGCQIAIDLINQKLQSTGKLTDDLIKNDKCAINEKDLQQIKTMCYDADLLIYAKMIPGTESSDINSDISTTVNDHIKYVLSILENNNIITYYEPDQEAISRSGDKLIVAKMDQWYIDYGDSDWKKASHDHLNQMTFTDDSVRNLLKIAINWLDQWPCSRTYGMGSCFPDIINDCGNHGNIGGSVSESELVPVSESASIHVQNKQINDNSKFIIDSLSDSTIYMALYTIYHFFETLAINPDQMTVDVFDYIFLLKYYDNPIYDKFKPMREEFLHWYPYNLRVSAKDLISNHLAMSIFNHVIIWDDGFKQRMVNIETLAGKNTEFGPIAYDINGYITVQKAGQKEVEKMSKSKGNFKTADQALSMYCADVIRFTFASATIGIEDAYFDQDLCKRMVERLYKEKDWIGKTLVDLNTVPSEKLISACAHNAQNAHIDMNTTVYPDSVFMNEMSILINNTYDAYKKLNFLNVVTNGFHLFQNLRDNYVTMIQQNSGSKVNPLILKHFIETQLFLMYPIIPHFCEYFYNHEHFCKDNIRAYGKSLEMSFPLPIDINKHWEHHYLTSISADITKKIIQFNKSKKKYTKIIIYVANKIIDPIEKIIHQIMKVGKKFDKIEIIAAGKVINPEMMKSDKNIGLLVKYFRFYEDLIKEYGTPWFELATSGNLMEYNSLTSNLKYYLRQDILKNQYEINIIEHTVDHCAIQGVRLNEPSIQYE
jgi:leucyl-tRNA synthetase